MEVQDIFYSIQGEGMFTGTPATFIRLSGCNVHCSFCDTNYNNPTSMTPWEIVAKVVEKPAEVVVITGGEPLLQGIGELVLALQGRGRRVHLETNGTLPLPPIALDWITCSPKGPVEDLDLNTLRKAHEIKFLCGVPHWEARIYEILYAMAPAGNLRLYLMPLDSGQADTTHQAVEFVKKHPEFRLCTQLHKYLNIK